MEENATTVTNIATAVPPTLLVNLTTDVEESSYVEPSPPCGNISGAGYIGGVPKEVIGDIIVIIAQIFMSFWMVYEEKVLSNYSIAPLQAVGIEG